MQKSSMITAAGLNLLNPTAESVPMDALGQEFVGERTH